MDDLPYFGFSAIIYGGDICRDRELSSRFGGYRDFESKVLLALRIGTRDFLFILLGYFGVSLSLLQLLSVTEETVVADCVALLEQLQGR